MRITHYQIVTYDKDGNYTSKSAKIPILPGKSKPIIDNLRYLPEDYTVSLIGMNEFGKIVSRETKELNTLTFLTS